MKRTKTHVGSVTRFGLALVLVAASAGIARAQTVVCGDNRCDVWAGETCTNCPGDCGTCTTTVPTVAITAPAEGTVYTATPCPFPSCSAGVSYKASVTAAAPVEEVTVDFYKDGAGYYSNFPICRPNDIIEGTNSQCPAPPFEIPFGWTQPQGEWLAIVKVKDVQGNVSQVAELRTTVLPANQTPAGPMSISGLTTLVGTPPLLLRENPDLRSAGDAVRIKGQNLDNNPYLSVYFTPVRSFDPSYSREGGLPTADWCKYDAEILDRGIDPDGQSFLSVRIPEIPARIRYNCAPGRDETEATLDLNWRIAIVDRWIRPERAYDTEAYPDPYLGQGQRPPYFRFGITNFPAVYGFGFANEASDAKLDQFLSVFGYNAYLCVGAFGVCATHVPDPLYWGPFFLIYRAVLGSTDGTCAGMSSTSQLFGNGDLTAEDWDSNVHFPAGFTAHGPDEWSYSGALGKLTGPPEATSLWAQIMKNHGVQVSEEFLDHVLDQIRGSFTVDTSPKERLEALRGNPRNFVLCGDKHCVTPFKVENNRISVYDNNHPNRTCFVDVDPVADTYDWSCRDGKGLKDLYTIPISVWKNGRSMPGLTQIGDAILTFVFGSSSTLYTDGQGGELGTRPDGTFVDALPGAKRVVPFSQSATGTQASTVTLPMTGAAYEVKTTAKGGSHGVYLAGRGRVFHVELPETAAQDQASFKIGSAADGPESVTVVTQKDGVKVNPTIGLALGDRERSVFTLSNLQVGRGEIQLKALPGRRGVELTNRTSMPTEHSLIVESADGTSGTTGRFTFGPFTVQPGATHRTVIGNWPASSQLDWEEDLDGDGTPERTGSIGGVSTPNPMTQNPDMPADPTPMDGDKPTPSAEPKSGGCTQVPGNHGADLGFALMLLLAGAVLARRLARR